MKRQRVAAMARKEWWHLLRDPRSLALMLLMPTMLLFLFGYAIRLDISEAPIGVLDLSHSAAGRELQARFDASSAFAVTRRFDHHAGLRAALQRGEIWGALVIPADYSRRLQQGGAVVQLLLDGVDANTARLLRNYSELLVTTLARERGGGRPMLTVEERVFYNETRESRLAIVPGVIALVMAVIGALMTSLTIAREMELGNLVMLRTTPLTRGEFLLGKLLPYFVLGMLDLAVATAAAVWVFDVPLRGSLPELVLVSGLFLLVVMLQGALISMLAGNQLLASQIALVQTFLPAFLLSGFVFAIDNMPLLLQYVTYAVPARYFVTLSKAIFLKGLSPLLLWGVSGALLLMLLVLLRLCHVKARRLGLGG
ncbi:MAG TPA: ABC transporter permease [Sedimenticola thiotaurini]|uniref:ABC transporter permease n=1 Tax=Sedimenticola thiotaurini TaxID=1543721 RepID=A0A831RQ66_9GAMM|nr:ABC transporter permease [Sedimenticola thiotaurini]